MRRSLRVGLVALLFAVGSIAQGQEIVSTVSPEMVETALRTLRLDAEAKEDTFTFLLRNRVVELKRSPRGDKLLVKAKLPQAVPLELLNRYNEEKAVTTRAVQYEKLGLILEAGVDCRLGVSANGLVIFLKQFGDDIAECETYLAQSSGDEKKTVAQLGKKSDPPVVGIGPGTAEIPSTNPVQPTKKAIPVKPIPGTPSVEKPPVVTPEPRPTPKVISPPVITPAQAAKAPLKFLDAEQKAFEIHFPTTDEDKETGWKILWDMATVEEANKAGYAFPKSRGKDTVVLFKIAKAYFKPTPTSPWIQVIEDAHPAEFYVPYFFRGTRFFDLRDVGNYVSLIEREGGPTGMLLGKKKNVMAEVRDRGLAYKFGSISRRGEELTLWGNFVAGNYTYLVEYGFQDDGTIVFRHAPTGYNYSHQFDYAHMHNCYWKVGIKLGPEGIQRRNFAEVVRIPTDPREAGREHGKLTTTPLSKESFVDWNLKEYTRLRVFNPDIITIPQNPAEKRPNLPLSYELIPYGQGQSRHARFEDEGFSLHDFWVTRGDCKEKMYTNLHKYFAREENLQPLNAGPVTIWHVSSGLHSPRGEDGILSGNNQNNGQALVHFTQFELVPRNVMTKTPIYRTETRPRKTKAPPTPAGDLE